ncbi:MAG: hypothetical protein IH608_03160, partial [Proteobacteria bacterium]|nr:hypothetical protein [Pseudomonadota bacterium]
GEGAAGSQGAQAWGRLVKDVGEIRAVGGRGEPKRLFQDGALRNYAAVQAAADSASQAAGRLCNLVTARVPGSPDLGVGAVFDLAGCPGGRGDGSYVALKVRHRYGKALGYVTEVTGAAP